MKHGLEECVENSENLMIVSINVSNASVRSQMRGDWGECLAMFG